MSVHNIESSKEIIRDFFHEVSVTLVQKTFFAKESCKILAVNTTFAQFLLKKTSVAL